MKKIIIYYPHILEYGGMERNIIGLAEEINKQGVQPVLVCFYDKVGMKRYCEDLEIVQIPDHWNPITKAFRLRRWLNKNQNEIKGLPLYFGGKAGFYAAIPGVSPYALHYTDPPSLLTGATAKSAINRLLTFPRRIVADWFTEQGVLKAKVCITMTRWNAVELKSLYGRDFEVVYQGGVPPSGNINSAPRCHGDTLRLFSICRIAASKNLNWILDGATYLKAHKQFKQWYSKIEVVIAGMGPQLQALKDQSAALGLDDILTFPGFLNAEEVENEYRNADIFLVPGRQGYGLPVLEALYRHVPVVLNVESRISEMLNENPWVSISDNSTESFSEKLAEHIASLKAKFPPSALIANVPTEAGWAQELGEKCLWW
ncbi:glycosyltransferase involved in cell wall biosynthesis [Mucilaginibacter gracilis]|uniref:Glycosyltransferase involved in cell wall biosynthesis n=1 Tax=Mucilaginibacter gracilis TaxID=423350 RepID=A0A495J0G1_9SPHI|nr:glycosyltransferase family 4 protein [Mucilaginibacter gracilis]RKR82253.1 glycosyltransferase involved in cell wall biosynthesis [Mucilaginibacter gracilis]